MKILDVFFKHQAGALVGGFLTPQAGQEQDAGVDFLLFVTDLEPDQSFKNEFISGETSLDGNPFLEALEPVPASYPR